MTVRRYVISLPERLLRSAVGLGAGTLREVGQVAVPEDVRRGHLYQNLVDTTLRYLIERVGSVDGVYPSEERLTEDFLLRRSAGNALELAGILAFRASPVWVLAALADVCGASRHLVPEIADALRAQGLLDQDVEFTTVEQMLDGLERTSSRLASAVNTPPLDVAALREELRAIRDEARSIAPGRLPSPQILGDLWRDLRDEAVRQNRSLFELSSMMALSASSALPDRLRWLSRSAMTAAGRAGHEVAGALLDHYRATLADIRQTGFTAYAARQFRPYLRAAAGQFSPKRRTWTDRIIEKWRPR